MKAVYVVLILFCAFQIQAQSVIKGKVVDGDGPVAGAVVFVQQSNISEVTDAQGRFRIEVAEALQVTLEVRFVGYKRTLKKLNLKQGETLEIELVLELDVLGLDDVVVSASRYEIDKKSAPVAVSVIGQKLFNATQSQSLADGLNFQSGVRVETNCQNCGFTQVRLNGLEGPYTQILVNSRPVFSALIGVYGLEMIPAYMIERVEVVKSGGSALYGSNAIAGTINIITKEPVLNTWEARSSFASIDGRASDWNHSVNGSYVSNSLNFGITGFATSRSRESFDANNDGFTEMVNLQAETLGLKSFYKVGRNTKLSVDFNYINEFRRGGNRLDLRPEYTDITEQLDHEIVMGAFNIDQFIGERNKLSLYASMQQTDRGSYYGGLGGARTPEDSLLAANAYGITDDMSWITGLQWVHSNDGSHSFTSGIEFQENTTDDGIPGYNRVVDQSVKNIGWYGQWEWQLNSKLKTLAGARFDRSLVEGTYQVGDFDRTIDNDFGVISPRFTLLYSFSSNWQFRGGYARGFRAPQAFNEDLHIASAGGEPVFVLLSNGLEKETSDAYTGSLSYTRAEGQRQFELNLQGFYTQLNNPFVLVNTGSQLPNGSIIEEVRNGEGALVKGLNLELNYTPSSRWVAQSGFTLQKTRYEQEQVLYEPENPGEGQLVTTQRFTRMPNAYGFWNLTYETTTDWQFFISNVVTGPMVVPEILQESGVLVLRNSGWFWDTTLKASHHFHIGKNLHIELSGGIQNLFNSYQADFQTGPTRDSDYIYGPGRPRTYFVSLKLSNND
ncbi:TonB-dependent receptor [Roseivirga thermotolerans]|jgi:outer membrane receptor for ferrienterochelin and colicins|uniref:TonB-dependent receptor n=1 Tax=Roseivirga thermotolerans TaxID=1758176 RepID=UPI00273F1B1D|nr:TonB-dependent receptor [Roseivirga thermotolerans]